MALSESGSVAVIANCQGRLMVQAMRVLAPALRVEFIHSTTVRKEPERKKVEARLGSFDAIVSHPLNGEQYGKLERRRLASGHPRVQHIPTIAFLGFHPDCVNVAWGKVKSPIGDYHSSLALWAFLRGLTPKEARRLYCEDVYARVGFFDEFGAAKRRLIDSFAALDFQIGDEVALWEARGRFMHTFNHPKAYVLADVARRLLVELGVPVLSCSPERLMVDNFPDSAVFPVFPEVAQRHGFTGDYVFKKAKELFGPLESPVLTLEQMIEQSFEIYAKFDRETLTCPRIEGGLYDERLDPTSFKAPARIERSAPNPYRGKPDHQFWRRAIADREPADVDPVVEAPFRISRTDKIATAGSCFAQHIAHALSNQGYRYYVTETAPPSMDAAAAREAQYGTYSARYGNLYTARQLLQLFDRSYGELKPVDAAWRDGNGRWVDPFRPRIQPGGYASEDAVVEARIGHFEATRRMWETLDVFVFTLGLTEAWRSTHDGAVLPLAPGVAGGVMDDARYEFVNFDLESVRRDLRELITRLRRVNPRSKVILTVSPVPLVATYEDRHVLVSTTYSKSVLRVAADEVAAAETDVAYFPSYEIITGGYNRGAYFADDLRSVTPEGVAHVMRLFLQHCVEERVDNDARGDAEAAHLREVICDEEALDPPGP